MRWRNNFLIAVITLDLLVRKTVQKSAAVFFFFAVVTAGFAADNPAVVIINSSKSDWKISPVSKNSPAVRYAAAELQKYFQQISGCIIPLSEKPGKNPTIIIGLRDDLSAGDRELLPARAEGFDGYAISIRRGAKGKPPRIVIGADNGRAALYGAYDLLERFGCRWFYPTEDALDPEVIPKLKTVSLSTNSWAVASPIEYRICNGSGWYFEIDSVEAIKQMDWGMKARYNAMGWQAEASNSKNSLATQYKRLGEIGVWAELDKREMFLHGPAHSFDQLLLTENYFAEHPEWFGLREGKRVPQAYLGAQFCWSNAEARKQFIKNAEAFIKNAPQIHIFCTIPFDGGQACECDECKKIGPSNLLMILMGELIEKLKISCPNVLVETVGGYGAVTDPPTNLEVIHPKQRVVWAHWGRYHNMGYDDDRYPVKPQLEKWRKAAKGGLTICQYYTDNFAEPWVMAPFAIALEGDRKYFLQHKIDAMYMLMWPRGYWWNHSLNGYLGGKCFYDVSLNPYELLHDYAQNYFGKDAGPLLGKYFEQWARNVDLSYHVRGDSTDKERAMLVTQRKEFLEPAMKFAKENSVLERRVGKVEKLHSLAERLMEIHRQRNEIQRLRKSGNFAKAEERLNAAKTNTDEVLTFFYTLADLNQGLIERKEVPTFIKANLKNWIDEEAKAIAAKTSK